MNLPSDSDQAAAVSSPDPDSVTGPDTDERRAICGQAESGSSFRGEQRDLTCTDCGHPAVLTLDTGESWCATCLDTCIGDNGLCGETIADKERALCEAHVMAACPLCPTYRLGACDDHTCRECGCGQGTVEGLCEGCHEAAVGEYEDNVRGHAAGRV